MADAAGDGVVSYRLIDHPLLHVYPPSLGLSTTTATGDSTRVVVVVVTAHPVAWLVLDVVIPTPIIAPTTTATTTTTNTIFHIPPYGTARSERVEGIAEWKVGGNHSQSTASPMARRFGHFHVPLEEQSRRSRGGGKGSDFGRNLVGVPISIVESPGRSASICQWQWYGQQQQQQQQCRA